jgi:long-chain-fatty-acid--CoA ligase ACSBG
MGNQVCREIDAVAPTNGPEDYFSYDSSQQWFTCQPDGMMPPRLAAKGPLSEAECPPTTLPELLAAVAAAKGEKPAMKVERPLPALVEGKAPPALPEEEWTTWSYAEWCQDARAAAKGCLAMGFAAFDAVNVWGFNSPEWHIAAFAASFAGGRVGGLYPTDTPDTAAFKVVHSGGSVVVVEDRSKVDKLVKALNGRGDATKIKCFVAYGFEPADGEQLAIAGCGSVPLLSWRSFLKLGEEQCSDEALESCIAAVQPGHCAALVYTSGTTGEPKAVMLSHDNIVAECSVVMRSFQQSNGLCAAAEQERLISYLPLSHVAGKILDIMFPVFSSKTTAAWTTVYFARPYDLKAGTIKDRLCAVRPTMFLGVPLVWEKIADKLRAIGAQTTGLKKDLASWAKRKGLEHAQECQLGSSGRYPSKYGLASKLVLNKVKGALGLDCCKIGLTGAAPIRVDTLEFFGALGLNINEVYGMSESTAASTISTDKAHLWGSCGYEAPGLEVRVFKADSSAEGKKTECPRAPGLDCIDEEFQGEICFRGRTIMMGYLANPDLGAAHVEELNKKTHEAIDSEGWLHSGDKGMMTAAGMLKITGRYKELIIGEGGENIAPVPIEDQVKKACEGICEVMMVGDKRKYNVALVTLKAVGANGEVPGTDELDGSAKRMSPDVTTISGAMQDKMWIEAITAAISSANSNGKVCPNNAFKIQKFTILPTNFSEEKGELTPTKKLKRKEVEKAYAKVIEALYASKETYVPYC